MITLMFADDTNIFIKGNNTHKMEITMNYEIKSHVGFILLQRAFIYVIADNEYVSDTHIPVLYLNVQA